MKKILVVEDNELHFSKMEFLLEEMDYDMVGHARNADETLRLVKATNPDLILMDIQILGETNGIQLAKKLNESVETPIIFTTSFKDPEIIKQAIETEPYAYLVKPVVKEELQASIELALFKMSQKNEILNTTYNGWNEDVLLRGSFFIKLIDRIEKVKYEDVLWVESADEEKYVLIKTNKEQPYKLRSSLKQIQQKLPSGFFRISNSHIINAEKIDHISDINNTINLGSIELKLSRSYKKELMQVLNLING